MTNISNVFICVLFVTSITCQDIRKEVQEGAKNVEKFIKYTEKLPDYTTHLQQYYAALEKILDRSLPKFFELLKTFPETNYKYSIRLYLLLMDKLKLIIRQTTKANNSLKIKDKQLFALYFLTPVIVAFNTLKYYKETRASLFKDEQPLVVKGPESDLVPKMKQNPLYLEVMKTMKEKNELFSNKFEELLEQIWNVVDMMLTNLDQIQMEIGKKFSLRKYIFNVTIGLSKMWNLMNHVPKTKYSEIITSISRLPFLPLTYIIGNDMLKQLINL